jgi:ATP adenylyltransferase
MPYIAGGAKAEKPEGYCFLCDHPAQEAAYRANLVVVVQEKAFVCLNRYPFTPSHLLVSPRRHVADLGELAEDEYGALMALVRTAADRLKKAVGCHGMNLGMNLGTAAGAGVADHLHMHLVPRWTGDTNFMPVLADIRVMPEYLDDAWRRLYAAFADVPGARAAPAPPGTSA